MRIAKVLAYLKGSWWAFLDRCEHCGGPLFVWSSKKAWCEKCGKYN